MTIIHFTPPHGPVVCTACGTTVADRAALDQHWVDSPICTTSLSRPIGQFGAKTRTHCEACHESGTQVAFGAVEPEPCTVHAYRGCPGC